MTQTQIEEARLRAAGEAAIQMLERMPQLVRAAGDTHHVIHDDYVERAVSLGSFLGSALGCGESQNYAAAYTLLRSALEHHLLDHLLLRSSRYAVYAQTKLEDFNRWHAEWTSGAEDFASIVALERHDGGTTRIVYDGPHVVDGDGDAQYRLSAYYAYLDDFDPLVGPPGDQRFLEVQWRDLAHLEERATLQQRLYGQAFSWKAIRSNLELNEFYVGEELVRLNVHYRFLSGFVHLTPASFRVAHRRPNSYVPYRERYRDHIALELVHLYIAAIGARELELLLAVFTQPPLAHIDDRHLVEAVAAEARLASRHLWFPGDPPHPYDEWRRQAWESWRRADEPSQEDVGVNEPYYRDPFERLAELHRGAGGGSGVYRPYFYD